MKIVYIGNYRDVDRYGRSYNTETHIARDLEHLGHDVVRFQEPPGGGDLSTFRQIEDLADGAALVLWTRTWGFPQSATALWRRLEARGVVTASYHLDLYHGLHRGERVPYDPFWTTGWVFTPDGNPDAQAWFERQGIRHVYSPPAVVSDEVATVMPGHWRPEYDYDVVFVGSYGYHPEWQWRPKLIDALAERYGARFRRFGGDQPEGPTRGQDLNDLYATARVVVGDSCFAASGQHYWSDRPYEGWGRGAVMVFPRIDALWDQIGGYPSYTPDDFESVTDMVDDMVAFPDEYRGAAACITETIADRHTYQHRLAAALQTMGLTP